MNMMTGNSLFQGTLEGTLTIKNEDDSRIYTRMAQSKKRDTIKKRLNYNPREISSQLILAKKAENATVILSRAKSKLSVLKRALVSGQYNEKEVRAAITHAKRMVECCRMKAKNLKDEEKTRQQNEREAENEIQQAAMKERLQKTRRMHRNRENGKISEADMKYLDDKMRIAGSETPCVSNAGIMFELGGVELRALSACVNGAASTGTQPTLDLTV